jgi:hypothetical protein
VWIEVWTEDSATDACEDEEHEDLNALAWKGHYKLLGRNGLHKVFLVSLASRIIASLVLLIVSFIPEDVDV